ncbi:MAG TPA: CCA tRNA nucleotidyltransferase [Phycisphaerales bacterium]|nr:CCA tRNA nucleotidyltransferase [Phycisphaerales bacterium]HIN83418.1 CCA tRNA nucleotidyltransferase [Phycisphaerales bacterium]
MNEICPIICRKGAIAILTKLRDAGFETYFAGGCVRDRLLCAAPTEYDIATSAKPEEIKKLFPKARSVGEAFGVMLVRSHELMYDVATFRSDGPYSDSRHPDSIQFSTAKEDAQRRDFTINGIFEDPIDNVLIDFVGGEQDLELRLVRAIGEPRERFAEDHLRMLRAIRFSSRFEFSIDVDTAEAIRELSNELAGISRERIGEEIKKMLTHPNRGVAAWELQYLGLDRIILSEESCMNAPTRLGRLTTNSTYATALAAWILDRNGSEGAIFEVASHWREQLQLSNKVANSLEEILQIHQTLYAWESLGVAKQKRIASAIEFINALAIIQSEDRATFIYIKRCLSTLEKTGLAPERLIDGNELIKSGIQPSSALGDILEAVYDAQLEGTISNKKEAITLAIAIYRDLLDS